MWPTDGGVDLDMPSRGQPDLENFENVVLESFRGRGNTDRELIKDGPAGVRRGVRYLRWYLGTGCRALNQTEHLSECLSLFRV